MSRHMSVTPVHESDVDHFDHETDVIVVGYGCAGAAASLVTAASCPQPRSGIHAPRQF